MMQQWVKLPTRWIDDGGLEVFRWRDMGADGVAALMSLIAIAHHAEDAVAKLTYGDLETATDLSRAKISAGLSILDDQELIEREPFGRSTFRLLDHGYKGWGKLPARGLYRNGGIAVFREFSLRRVVELNALKLYLLFVARRDNNLNMANISYDKITEYTGMEREKIRSAISLLAALGLVHVESIASIRSDYGTANAYRLAYLDSFIHGGTRGRGNTTEDFETGGFSDLVES